MMFHHFGLYPTIMINYDLISRNLEDSKNFVDTYWTRINAKHNGDKKTASALKLPLNTTYGAMINEFNDLYDPRQGRGVCITGQLFITELTAKYLQVPTVDVIQINTDGVMIMLDDKYLSEIYKINKEWSEKTHFELEEDKIRKIVQRDCNNYVMITTDGKIKFKGGELNNYNPTGEIRWKKHNLEICAEALVKKLLYDIPIDETISTCNDLSKFQMISKVGHTYNGCKRLINGEYIPWQKVNRLYACIDDRYGNELYKCKEAIKKDEGIYERHDKVANCPHNTMIDGYDEISIDILDKQWYIDYTTNKYEKFIEN